MATKRQAKKTSARDKRVAVPKKSANKKVLTKQAMKKKHKAAPAEQKELEIVPAAPVSSQSTSKPPSHAKQSSAKSAEHREAPGSGATEIDPEIKGMDLTDLATELEKSRIEIEELEQQLGTKRSRAQQLSARVRQINDAYRASVLPFLDDALPSERGSRRNEQDPIKNLKISAIRSIDWAKKDGVPVAEAINRALTRTSDRARKTYGMDKLPDEIAEYIKVEAPRFFMEQHSKEPAAVEVQAEPQEAMAGSASA